MKADDIRLLGAEGRQNKLKELKEVFFSFRFKNETGQLDDTSKLKYAKRDIARIETINSEMKNKE